jgi:hypothetical protein
MDRWAWGHSQRNDPTLSSGLHPPILEDTSGMLSRKLNVIGVFCMPPRYSIQRLVSCCTHCLCWHAFSLQRSRPQSRIDLLQALENHSPGTRNKIWQIPSAGVRMVSQILFSNGPLPWPGPPTIELPLHISLRLGLYLSNWIFLDSSGPSMDVSANAS